MAAPSVQENEKRCAGDGDEEWHEKLAIGKNCYCGFSNFHRAPRVDANARV
jgi:hypothetical protein